eukprot:5963536-Pleurochrysis_carterae.AAC.7
MMPTVLPPSFMERKAASIPMRYIAPSSSSAFALKPAVPYVSRARTGYAWAASDDRASAIVGVELALGRSVAGGGARGRRRRSRCAALPASRFACLACN